MASLLLRNEMVRECIFFFFFQALPRWLFLCMKNPAPPNSNKLEPNSRNDAGSGTALGGVTEVNEGVIVRVPVPLAPAATLTVPVMPSELTPANVVLAAPPPSIAVSLPPLFKANETSPEPLAPVPKTKLALRSVIDLPVGAATVKLNVLPLVRPANALRGIDRLKPPALAPEVMGVILTIPDKELDKLLETAL